MNNSFKKTFKINLVQTFDKFEELGNIPKFTLNMETSYKCIVHRLKSLLDMARDYGYITDEQFFSILRYVEEDCGLYKSYKECDDVKDIIESLR